MDMNATVAEPLSSQRRIPQDVRGTVYLSLSSQAPP
jgi:hypothetical protein